MAPSYVVFFEFSDGKRARLNARTDYQELNCLRRLVSRCWYCPHMGNGHAKLMKDNISWGNTDNNG